MSSDVVERMKMCIAEAGFDPRMVSKRNAWKGRPFTFDTRLPRPVAWRARETAGFDKPRCFACFCDSTRRRGDPRECHATERFTDDCGTYYPR